MYCLWLRGLPSITSPTSIDAAMRVVAEATLAPLGRSFQQPRRRLLRTVVSMSYEWRAFKGEQDARPYAWWLIVAVPDM